MPAALSFDRYLADFAEAVTAFARHAHEAGLDVDVPTCPDWTVRRLIGHQGAVHRWAAGSLRGQSLDWEPLEKQGRSSPDPVEWLRDGAVALVRALSEADDDAEAAVFLHDAAAPKYFWVRRQCHETTMHAVDALAAALGRLPSASETWIGTDLALDGIDELILGFVPRSKSRLRSPEPVTIAVVPTDADHSYTVEVSPDTAPVSTRHEGAAGGDLVASADAVTLYLALWHRTGLDSPLWPLWHETAVL